jgi:choline dehydrogenase-like flavoprotein
VHIDLQELGLPSRFRSDVCIVGGGVAGILLASRLRQSGREVHLLEAGGLENEERSQSLYRTAMAGYPHTGAAEGRFRTFGGSSTRWGGQLLPYTEDVLHPPTCLGLPEWPLNLSELEPYYADLEQAMGVPSVTYSAELLREFGRVAPFTSDRVRLRFSKCAPFVRRNLSKTLGQDCLSPDAATVTVFTHANVVSIDLQANGEGVESLTAVNYGRVRYTFEAKEFVLCTGTIEASRLLLDSTEVCKQGVGNSRDQVGRYFHDHVGVRAGTILGPDRGRVVGTFAPLIRKGTTHRAKLEGTAELRCEKRLLSVAAQFAIEEPEGSGAEVIRGLLRAMQRGRLDQATRREMMALPAASAEVAGLLYMARVRNRRFVSKRASVVLDIDVEQRPDSESRVRLGDETNALEMRKAVLDWKISEEEQACIRSYAKEIDLLFRRHSLAMVPWNPGFLSGEAEWLDGSRLDTFHMMGGTRMGTDPSSSVVDSSLRVHGVRNLSIVSCSVFPTGGSSNPTFTMMALAFRLADRLGAH